MKFYSDDFADYGPLDKRFTQESDDLSPTFVVDDVPKNTACLVLTMHDIDSPGGKEWTHWLVWDISPSTKTISSSKLPHGATEGLNDFGDKGYGGPLPSPGTGDHRYVFSLFALDKAIDFPANVTRNKMLKLMPGHILAQSMWVGTYHRDAST